LTQHLVNVVELYSGYALCMLHYLTALTYENGNLHTINAVSVQRRIACAHVSIRLLFHGCQTTRYDRESFFGNRRSSVGPWQWGGWQYQREGTAKVEFAICKGVSHGTIVSSNRVVVVRPTVRLQQQPRKRWIGCCRRCSGRSSWKRIIKQEGLTGRSVKRERSKYRKVLS
jgi:hypothetical protein